MLEGLLAKEEGSCYKKIGRMFVAKQDPLEVVKGRTFSGGGVGVS